ncbi:hypothetical protein SLE2022_384560 [Rubroshorea leprosula]
MRGKARERFNGKGPRGRGTAQRWETSNLRRWNRPVQDGKEPRQNSSRNSEIRGYDRQIFNQASVYFFTNFPKDWKHENMWHTFHKYGRVLDIYSPMRKSRMGSRFGFVRFLDVRNEKELEHQLDQIRVGEFKLWVNKPRFNEQEKQLRVAQRQKENAGVRGHRTFAEVVKGNSGSGAKLESRRAANGAEEHGQARINNLSRNPKQVWRAKDVEQAKAGISFTVQEEEYAWLQGCYVGIAHSVEIIPTLQEKFFMEGYFSCRIRAMGGCLVLLEGGDKEEIKDLVELAPKWLGQWFTEVKPWCPSMVARERFVWLRCQGVPTHVWGPNFFATIGTVWGKFITLDDSTSKKQRFDIGRMLISTPVMDFISKSINILVNGEPYLIKVMEEEAPNGIFSMKSDHVFRELSDSDDVPSESWSLDGEVDDEVSVVFLGGGEVNGNRNSTSGKKVDDDVEVEDEVTEEEDRDEQPLYRWT